MRVRLRLICTSLTALVLAAGLSGFAQAAPNGAPPVTVMIDHAKVVKLPEKTQTVIVGNPIIADVTVQRNGILVVTSPSTPPGNSSPSR